MLVSGKEHAIKITAKSGLSEDEIKRMVREAESNADADKKRRDDIMLKNNLDNLVYQTEKLIKDNEAKIAADNVTKAKEIIAESGILTDKEELDTEPKKVVIFLKSAYEVEWEKALLTLWRSNSDYFMIERIIGDKVPEKYKDMKDAAGNSNCAFICSSTSCSS